MTARLRDAARIAALLLALVAGAANAEMPSPELAAGEAVGAVRVAAPTPGGTP